jgi:hypothetical protein
VTQGPHVDYIAAHITVICTIVLAWIFIGASCLGIGLLLRRLFQSAPLQALDLFVAFWVGWAGLLALLQVWHLLLPISAVTQLLAAILGAAGLALEWRALVALVLAALRSAPGPLAFLGLALPWMANRSTGPAQNYDLGLYYLQVISWNSSYAIVPGLGNLHTRFGFNNSYFLYAAITDVGPLAGKAINVANGLLFVALLAQALFGITAILMGHGRQKLAFWSALTLAPILYLSFGSEAANSSLPVLLHLHGASPDEGVFALGLFLSTLLLLIIEPNNGSHDEQAFLRFAAALLAVAGVAVKLSFLAFATAAILVIYAPALWDARRAGVRALLQLFAPLAVCLIAVGGVWAARGVVLSGYPFYPSTFGAMPVPWRIPTALAMSDANWARGWGRAQGLHWVEALGTSAWLQTWIPTMAPQLVRPLALLAATAGLALVSLVGSPPIRLAWFNAVRFLLPAVASACFWFFTVPGARFAGSVFWVLALGLALLATERLCARLAVTPAQLLVRMGAIVGVLLFVAPVRVPFVIVPPADSTNGRWPLPQPVVQMVRSASGLETAIPVDTNQCWATPLPCTPAPRLEMRARTPGNLGGGFLLDQRRQYVDIHLGDLQPTVTAPTDLGVALAAGWYAYDYEAGDYWMQDKGYVLLFTERPRRTNLTLTVGSILSATGFAESGRLQVTLDNGSIAPIDLHVDEPASLLLELHKGFNVIKLLPEGGAFVPAEVIDGNTNTRRLSIALRKLELTDE